MTAHTRRAGLLVPLFAFPSSRSWGIGDIGDVDSMAVWLAGAGQRVLQLLPLNEMAPGQQSPYSAVSAMAIDPIFISVPDVPDLAAAGSEGSLDAAEREQLRRVQLAGRVDYRSVRGLKQKALTRAFDRFVELEWSRDTVGAHHLKAFLARESWWIDDYALFRALLDREDERPWTEWPEALQRRDPRALDAAGRELWRQILFHQYLQWIADAQWSRARAAARAHGVLLFGDLPFMVDGNSADVWAQQDQFRLDASVGVPPDAFSATGQDWGMPAYRWDILAGNDFRWLRHRARRSAALYDGYRVDHLVGFYRTYSRPRSGGEPSFEPSTEPEQQRLGERILGIFREAGAEIIAEDLGIVPDFVRRSLARLGVPGFCIFRWERRWHEAGEPFIDPASYAEASVATSGTHDTETLAAWWDHMNEQERKQVAEIPTLRRLAPDHDLSIAPYSPTVRDSLLEALFASPSELLLLPIQDVFGWHDRINEPATVTAENWTFRLPWPCDRMEENAAARERQATLRTWAQRYRRIEA